MFLIPNCVYRSMNNKKARGLTLFLVLVFSLINILLILSLENVIANMMGLYERFGVADLITPTTILVAKIILGVGSGLCLLGSLVAFSKAKIGKVLMLFGGLLTITTTGFFLLILLLIFRNKFD